jgi:Transposase domain (DUF772)
MRPRERRETGEQDLFRSRLDQIIDMNHALARLARTVDWPFLEGRFGEVYTDDPGHPPLPTRLMAGLAILKHTYDLSDEVLCERWVENPYYQYFCGEQFFQHHLVFDRSSMTRWRNRMGEERLQALLQESLSIAVKTEAIKPSELSRVIVDITVQPKNITFPTDAKLLNRAREKRLDSSLSAKGLSKGKGAGPSSRVDRRAVLVGALGKQDGWNGYDHDLAVERQGPLACIIGVARNTLFVGRVASTGDLPKPRNPGPASGVGLYRRAISPQFVLSYGSRTNDAHVAH